MARTRTVAQFAGRVVNCRIFRLLVRTRFVFACVATCAVRLECRELPVDDLGISLVAGGTGQVVTVILWLIRQSRVPVVGWRPGIRVMTLATVDCRVEVTRVLAGGYRAVVAGSAGSQDLVVINRDDG